MIRGNLRTVFSKKTIMKPFIYIVLFFYCTSLLAQDFQLAGVAYNYFPKISFQNGVGNQQISFTEASTFLSIPIQFSNDKTTIVNTVKYTHLRPSLQDLPLISPKEDDEQLHKLSYSFLLLHKFNEKWTFITRLMPLIASDFKDSFSQDDLFFQGAALLSRKMNEHLTLGAGAVYTVQTGEPRFLPVLQVKYEKEKHLVDIVLPSYVTYLYTVDKKENISLGFHAKFEGARYNISIDEFIEGTPDAIDSVIYARANAGALLRFKIFKKFHLDVSGGISTARRYQFETDQNQSFNFDPTAGTFIGLGLFYIPLG